MSNCKHEIGTTTFGNLVRCDNCGDVVRELPSSTGSLSGFGSEAIAARWEQRAKDCEKTAEEFRSVMQNFVSSYLEKARAFRDCIEDLHRQVEHEKNRQPKENDPR